MIDEPSSSSPTDLGTPAAVTTFIHDPLRGEVLLRLTGAVVLPPGSLIELSDGVIARVSALKLDARDAGNPALIVHVTPSRNQP